MERLWGESLSEHYGILRNSQTKAQNFKGRKVGDKAQRMNGLITYIKKVISHLKDKGSHLKISMASLERMKWKIMRNHLKTSVGIQIMGPWTGGRQWRYQEMDRCQNSENWMVGYVSCSRRRDLGWVHYFWLEKISGCGLPFTNTETLKKE